MTASIVREAEIADAATLAAVIRTVFRATAERFDLTPANCPTHPSFCTREWIESDMARGILYFVVEVEGRISGCAALEPISDELAYLQKVGILPGHRRRGLGRALVGHVLDEAHRCGVRVVRVALVAELGALVKWYKKLGFIEVKTEKFANLPFSVVFMEKSFGDDNPAKDDA